MHYNNNVNVAFIIHLCDSKLFIPLKLQGVTNHSLGKYDLYFVKKINHEKDTTEKYCKKSNTVCFFKQAHYFFNLSFKQNFINLKFKSKIDARII